MKIVLTVACLGLLTVSTVAADKKVAAQPTPAALTPAEVKWIAFPNPQLELRGLPWFADNAPELWRFPRMAKDRVPKGVWTRAVCPDGGRIRFASDTSRLAVRIEVVHEQKKLAYFDAYAGDEFAGSAGSEGPKTAELVLFEGRKPESKTITIYLPNTTEVRVLAVGIAPDATVSPPAAFALDAPLVCYGSSVLQGTGSDHPSTTYPAVLARRLNLDFVNFGFGGSGRAEPDVVALINLPKACGFLFDLGKSYGAQPRDPFARMFADVRAKHPQVPIFCVTPIYSTKEATEPGYREKSEDLRTLMRGVAVERQRAGDRQIYVVEGLDVFGAGDKALFHDSLHPGDAGNERLGERLVPFVRAVILGAQ